MKLEELACNVNYLKGLAYLKAVYEFHCQVNFDIMTHYLCVYASAIMQDLQDVLDEVKI